MMTRQHFEAIAKTLDANHAPLALVEDFADMCAESNPRFDREKFIRVSTVNLSRDQFHDANALARACGTL